MLDASGKPEYVKKPQTTGSPGFHTRLGAVFEKVARARPAGDNVKGNIRVYIEALKEFLKNELWDGELYFMPDALKPRAELIASDYVQGSGDMVTNETLAALARWAAKQPEAIGDDIESVAMELTL